MTIAKPRLTPRNQTTSSLREGMVARTVAILLEVLAAFRFLESLLTALIIAHNFWRNLISSSMLSLLFDRLHSRSRPLGPSPLISHYVNHLLVCRWCVIWSHCSQYRCLRNQLITHRLKVRHPRCNNDHSEKTFGKRCNKPETSLSAIHISHPSFPVLPSPLPVNIVPSPSLTPRSWDNSSKKANTMHYSQKEILHATSPGEYRS